MRSTLSTGHNKMPFSFLWLSFPFVFQRLPCFLNHTNGHSPVTDVLYTYCLCSLFPKRKRKKSKEIEGHEMGEDKSNVLSKCDKTFFASNARKLSLIPNICSRKWRFKPFFPCCTLRPIHKTVWYSFQNHGQRHTTSNTLIILVYNTIYSNIKPTNTWKHCWNVSKSKS